MVDWEEQFKTWAKPLSKTVDEKCENAVSVITNAIKDEVGLSKINPLILPQGSYKSGTNIRYDSDVDVCILHLNVFFAEYPQGKTHEDFGNHVVSLTYTDFKDMVEAALVKKVGRKGVARGNKAFDVHENTYRIDSDVVPAFRHRRYYQNRNGTYSYHEGIEFRPDDGGSIVNWPEQAYVNGNDKDENTGKTFKPIVRIIKNLRNKMQDDKIDAAIDISSSLIESMVYNVANGYFAQNTYLDVVRNILFVIYGATESDEKCKEWLEVNRLKYLLGPWQPMPGQPWTREQARKFVLAAWNYVGFK